MESDDAALVARAVAGSREAFREIFERHHRFIYRFLYGITSDHGRAEDLVQDTFLAAYRGLGSMRVEARLSTWLCAIAKNLAAKSYRRQRRLGDFTAQSSEARPLPVSESPESLLVNREMAHALSRALQELDEDKRVVFTLKVIEGLSYADIAEITGCAIPKLKTDLFRAKSRMRDALGGYVGRRR